MSKRASVDRASFIITIALRLRCLDTTIIQNWALTFSWRYCNARRTSRTMSAAAGSGSPWGKRPAPGGIMHLIGKLFQKVVNQSHLLPRWDHWQSSMIALGTRGRRKTLERTPWQGRWCLDDDRGEGGRLQAKGVLSMNSGSYHHCWWSLHTAIDSTASMNSFCGVIFSQL